MGIGRLGLIGGNNSKRTSGIYSPDENLSKENSKEYLTTFSYDGKFNALTQAGAARGFAFSDDGTILLVCTPGTRTTAKITEWLLSTPFDITTAVYQSGRDTIVGDYDIDACAISAYSNYPDRHFVFGGPTSDTLWTCAYNTGPGPCLNPYVGKLYLGAQDSAPKNPIFLDNGAILLYLGNTNKTIYQYSLSTPYDINTATYSGKSFLITEDANPQAIQVLGDVTSSDTCLALLGATSMAMYFYSFDYDTNGVVDISATKRHFSLNTKSVSAQAASSRGTFVSLDYLNGGGYILTCNVTGTPNPVTSRVYQYNIANTLSISNSTYSGQFLDVVAYDSNAWDVYTVLDKVYVLGNTTRTIYEFNGFSGDISQVAKTAPISSFSVNTQASEPYNTYIGQSGASMYVLNQATNTVFQYQLAAGYDVTSAFYLGKNLPIARDTDCRGLFFRDDGAKMYILGNTTDTIYSYTLSTPWDVSTGTSDYIPKSYSVNTQATEPYDTYIGDNGTKMYVLNQATDAVFQYTLSTPYNVSTAVYANKTISVTTQESDPRGMYFKSDGTKMYIIGITNNAVFSYTLSTPWDIATAVADYTPKSYLHSAQTTFTQDLFIGDNGTKLYIMSGSTATTDTVFQYNLSVAWDVTSATYSNKSFSVNTQSTDSQAVFFKNDGTKMYILDNGANRINQYSLSTAWDVSTSSFDNLIFNVGTQEATPTSMYISPDGLNLYVGGHDGDDLNQYLLSTPWNISTATFIRASVVIGDATQLGLYFKSDGTKAYVVGATNGNIFEYNLSTPWNVATLSLGRTLTYSSQLWATGPAGGIFFKDDGTKFYIANDGLDRVHEFSLSVPWQVTSVTGRYSIVSEETGSGPIYISPDGLNMYVTGTTGDDVNQYSLSTAWDTSSATFVRVSATHTEATATGLFFSNDGTRMYVSGSTLDTIREYVLTTPWDVSSISLVTSLPIGHFDATITGLHFNPTGTEMYITGGTNNTIYQLSLSSPWRSSYIAGYFRIATEETGGLSMYISPDGLNMYVTGNAGADINQYSLATAWDISTASYVRVSASHGEGTPTGLFFSPTGESAFVLGQGLDTIREFSLPTPWNVTGMTLVRRRYVGDIDATMNGIFIHENILYLTGGTNNRIYQCSLLNPYMATQILGILTVGFEEGSPVAMDFSPDGTKLFVIGNNGDDVNQYSLSVSFEISTAQYEKVSVNIGDTEPRGLTFSPDGRSMQIVGQTGDTIREFYLSTPWDIGSITYNRSIYIGHLTGTAQGICKTFGASSYSHFYVTGPGTIYQIRSLWNDRQLTFAGMHSLVDQETVPTAFCPYSDDPNSNKIVLTGHTGDDINFYTYSFTELYSLSLTESNYIGKTVLSLSFLSVSQGHGEATPFGLSIFDYLVIFNFIDYRYYKIGCVTGSTNRSLRFFLLNGTTVTFLNTLVMPTETAPSGIFITGGEDPKVYISGTTADCIFSFDLNLDLDVMQATDILNFQSNNFFYIGTIDGALRSVQASGVAYTKNKEMTLEENSFFRMYVGTNTAIREFHRNATYLGSSDYRKSFKPVQTSSLTLTEAFGVHSVDSTRRLYITLGSTAASNTGRSVRIAKRTRPPNDYIIPIPETLISTAVLDSVEIIGAPGLLGNPANLWNIYVTPDEMRMFVLSPTVQGIYQFSRRFA